MEKTYQPIGTIIHGTMRTEDLLAAFADALESAMARHKWQGMTDQDAAFSEYLDMIAEASAVDAESERAAELVNEDLFWALNDLRRRTRISAPMKATDPTTVSGPC